MVYGPLLSFRLQTWDWKIQTIPALLQSFRNTTRLGAFADTLNRLCLPGRSYSNSPIDRGIWIILFVCSWSQKLQAQIMFMYQRVILPSRHDDQPWEVPFSSETITVVPVEWCSSHPLTVVQESAPCSILISFCCYIQYLALKSIFSPNYRSINSLW